jgi:hypothetical protein
LLIQAKIKTPTLPGKPGLQRLAAAQKQAD